MKYSVDRDRAWEIIDRFNYARVIVVGDIIIDQFIWGRVSRISPEAPVPVVDVHTDNHLLGGSANVMNNISSMGGQVCLTGVVGADEAGNLLIKKLREINVDPAGVVTEQHRPTTVKTRIIAHGQQVVRFDRERRKALEPSSEELILEYIGKELKRGPAALVISDYNKGVVTEGLIAGVRRMRGNSGLIVCVDPKRSDFSFYQGLDVITPNHHEAERALDASAGNDLGIQDIGLELLGRYDFRAILITRGEDGMSLFEKNHTASHTLFPTEAKEVYDVTGAGDTVIGVFALALAAGADFKEAAYLANHAAGIAVAKLGTATVTQKELKKSL